MKDNALTRVAIALVSDPKLHCLRKNLRTILASGIVAVGLLVGAQSASAQGTCIQDVWKAHGNSQNLTCTANDVTLSSAKNIDIITGGECKIENGVRVCRCFPGGTVTFTADFEMDLTADTRYDIGFYIATDSDPNGDGALTGQCTATAATATNAPVTFKQLDAAPDACGDITGPLGTEFNPQFVKAQISTQCTGVPGGKLELPFCTTWRQPGSNQVCLGTGNGTTTNDVFPGSPSKCNCGTLVLDIFTEQATITITKTALTPSVPETGGSATYSVSVKNNAAVASVTLDSLLDNVYGDITQVQGAVTATTCVPDNNPATCQVGDGAIPGSGAIAAGATCSCTFTADVPPGNFPGSFTDVVTASGTDSFANPVPPVHDDAVVPYTDVSSAPTLTKTASNTACRVDVTYDVVVTNTSTNTPGGGDTLTLNTLTDDVYGNITQVQGNVVSTTCGQSPGPGTLPAVIAVGGNYSCQFVGRISTCNTTVHDTVTGATVDQDGVPFSPSNDATVVITVTTP
jgi:hypothetical protein